jgi:hypothetical protein
MKVNITINIPDGDTAVLLSDLVNFDGSVLRDGDATPPETIHAPTWDASTEQMIRLTLAKVFLDQPMLTIQILKRHPNKDSKYGVVFDEFSIECDCSEGSSLLSDWV